MEMVSVVTVTDEAAICVVTAVSTTSVNHQTLINIWNMKIYVILLLLFFEFVKVILFK